MVLLIVMLPFIKYLLQLLIIDLTIEGTPGRQEIFLFDGAALEILN